MISQSKTLRDVIYRLWEIEQPEVKLDSKSFYRKDMGILIGKYLEVLKKRKEILDDARDLSTNYN